MWRMGCLVDSYVKTHFKLSTLNGTERYKDQMWQIKKSIK
jgi:hypothetical protein